MKRGGPICIVKSLRFFFNMPYNTINLVALNQKRVSLSILYINSSLKIRQA